MQGRPGGSSTCATDPVSAEMGDGTDGGRPPLGSRVRGNDGVEQGGNGGGKSGPPHLGSRVRGNDGGLAGAAGRLGERTGAVFKRLMGISTGGLQTRPYSAGGSAAVEEAMRTAGAARDIDLSALSGEELRRSFRSLRLDAAGAGGRRELAMGAAVVSEALARGLSEGDGPRFRVTDEQVAAGLLMYGGAVVEMGAGEGKTVAGAFPAAFHALVGGCVHVHTANDYLAARDAELLSPAYGALGLDVGAVLGPMTDPEREIAYSRGVVYGTLREFGFDFLRDNLRLPPDPPVQSALYAAVIDEADQVLLDQARSPLIISGGPSGAVRGLGRSRRAMAEMVEEQRAVVGELEERLREPGLSAGTRDGLLARLMCADHDGDAARRTFAAEDGAYERAAGIVADSDLSDPECEIVRDLYFLADVRRGAVALTETGRAFVERRMGYGFDTGGLQRRLDGLERDDDIPLADVRPLAANLRRRIARRHSQANQVTQLLRAYTLLRRDVHYIVSEGRIVLIDQETGRTLPDSRYRFGIHAALEAKEGLRVRDEPKTLAQMSVRGFVARYERVCGMTGTASGAERELMSQFGLDVQVVAPSNPQRRSELGPRLYASRGDKLDAVADEAAFWHDVGRPVLIGAPTIEELEEISRRLGERGVAHSLLNAAASDDEGEIVRRAGYFGAVTVATNMAGRGADIVVDPAVNERVTGEVAGLVARLMGEGAGRVVVRCANAGDVATLGAALSRDGTAWALRPGEPVIVVGDGEDREVALEFGLGLYVIGTELNTTTRTDRQLIGRTGRQGAPGASRFMLSREDRLLAFGRAESGVATEDAVTEPGGRVRAEGDRVARRLSEAQGRAESNSAAERAVTHEFDRILEAQTHDYYAARGEVLEADEFRSRCGALAREYAAEMVTRWLPAGAGFDYARGFARVCEELRLDFGEDASHLEGLGPAALGEALGELLSDRLDVGIGSLDGAAAERLLKLLYLQASDELWGEHLDHCQQLMVGVSLAALDLRGAIVECALRCREAYEAFRRDSDAEAVRRMLRFDAESVFAGEEPAPEVPGDLELIV